MKAAAFTLSHGSDLEELWQAMSRLGFVNEFWPQPIEKHKYMISERTGLRARFSYNLNRARWTVELIWEP